MVEIIHTAAGDKILRQATGDVDYYPNGGSVQPGCENGNIICNHFRGFELYAEAINSAGSLVSRMCNNYENFTNGLCNNNEIVYFPGAQKIIKPSGKYYLLTNNKQPFGLGEEGSIRLNTSYF